MKEIELTQGKVALVDDADYERVSQYEWFAWHKKGKWYAMRNTLLDNGKRGTIRLHRFILGASKGDLVDHVNGDGLDCRRLNLRSCSNIQNLYNRGMQINNKSGFKGVSKHSQCDKWVAEITVNCKKRYLGIFDRAESAARAYDAAAIQHHGEFAHLNFEGER